MTPQDLGQFAEWFHDLAATFKLYGTEDQKAATLASYFQTMQRFPLDRVRLGYEKLKETAQKWPVPAMWIGAMPKWEGADLPIADWRQAKAYDEAEQLFFEGDFCTCRECAEANATHLALRYVPCLDATGEPIKLRHPSKLKPVYAGEWIHGYRLKRWWAARGEFFATMDRLKPGIRQAITA